MASLKSALISLGSTSSKWTLKAMQRYFAVVDDLNIKEIEINIGKKEPEILYQGEPLANYDCIYAKGSFRYATLLRILTSLLKDKCYMPIDEDAFTVVHDKILTQIRLQQNKIAMPATYLSATVEAAKKILANMNYPVIMKFPQGTGGKGVMYAESFPAATSMMDALTALKQPFLIQEYIETEGTDIRAIVIGDKVVASMHRIAAEGEKRANIHSGGRGEACVLDSHARKIAVETAKAIGAEICGVDLLESVKGPLVIEANLSPGLQGITTATNVDIANEIAKYLHKKTKEFTAKRDKTAAAEIMKDLTPTGPGKQIITHLDFRGERILLPPVATKETGFTEKDELLLKVEKGKLSIEKFEIGKEG